VAKDRLDDLPQVPQDWANHILWGGAEASVVVVIIALLTQLGGAVMTPMAYWYWAFALVLLTATVKKVFDYIIEHESLAMCIGKAWVTTLMPGYILVMHWVGLLP
jgi:hypothetical protein